MGFRVQHTRIPFYVVAVGSVASMMMDAFEGTAASTPSRLKRLDSACSHSWFTKVLYSLGPQGFGCSRIWMGFQGPEIEVDGLGLRVED